MKRVAGLVLGALICLALGYLLRGILDTKQDDFYMTAKRLIETDRAKARQYIEGHFKGTGNPEGLYMMAWQLWQQGEYQNAETIVDYLLGSYESGWLRANTLLLKGYLRSNFVPVNSSSPAADYEAALKESLSNFAKANEYYREINHAGNQYHCLLGLASSTLKLALLADNGPEKQSYLDQAGKLLEQADQLNQEAGKNKTYYLSLLSRHAFARGEFQTARDISQQELDGFGKDPLNQVNSLIDAGFYALLVGDLETASSTVAHAEKVWAALDQTKANPYNEINLLMLAKCSGESTASKEDVIKSFAKTDPLLQVYFQFALSWSCPRENTP